MQAGQKRLLHFLGNWAINTLAVAVASVILHNHIHYYRGQPFYLFIAAFILGLLNAFVRPILLFLALPLLIVTLGLFTWVINALLLYLVGRLMTPYFTVDTFGSAFLGSAIISVVSIALNVLTGNARVTVRRGQPPPPPGKKPKDDDVIDV